MNKKSPYLLPFRCVIFLLVFLGISLVTGKSPEDIGNWWSPLATVINIITIGLLILIAHKNKQTYFELINYQKGKTKIVEIIVITMIVLVVGTGGMYLAGFICYGKIPYNAPMIIAPIPKVVAILNSLLLPVTTAFAEDGLYLGYGVNRIKNKFAAILIPAFFFALQHSFIPTLFDARFMIYRFISFLPLTIILCAYYYRKRNPLPVMIGHALIDVATVSWILITSLKPEYYEKLCNMA